MINLEKLEREGKIEILEFKNDVSTSEKSAKESGYPIEKITKSILVIANNIPILVIIQGDKRINIEKLSKYLNTEVRLAKAREVERYTGFKIGGVCPLLVNTKKVLDKNILNLDEVLIGGGDTHKLIKIKVKDLIELTNPEIIDIT
ncbi:Cys-tRNA(Pro) deacylase [Nanoarchaeota archaeon]